MIDLIKFNEINGKTIKTAIIDKHETHMLIIFEDKTYIVIGMFSECLDTDLNIDDFIGHRGNYDLFLKDNGFITQEEYDLRILKKQQYSEFLEDNRKEEDLKELQRLKKKYNQ